MVPFYPFYLGGLLIKTEQYEKGYPYYLGFTGEPSGGCCNDFAISRKVRSPSRTRIAIASGRGGGPISRKFWGTVTLKPKT